VPEILPGRREGVGWHPRCVIEKYSAGQVAHARRRAGAVSGTLLRTLFAEPEDGIVCDEGNGVTGGGAANLAMVIVGGSGYPLAPGRSVFGVGADGATPFSVEHAHLSPAQGEDPDRSFYRPMDPGYPLAAGPGVIEGQATFAETEACFAWHEWCWAAGPSAPLPHHQLHRAYTGGPPVMVNRRCSPAGYGKKLPGVAWVFRTVVTIGYRVLTTGD
jgi:hypothetical protein